MEKNKFEWSSISGNFKLLQRNDKFKFGTDAVLLSNFADIKSRYNVVDLCSGTGAVGFISYLKYSQKHTIFVDIDEEMTELSKTTAGRIIFPINLQVLTAIYTALIILFIKNQWADYITVNPPYFNLGNGKTNKNKEIISARHCNENFLDTLFKKSFSILKDGGKIAVVDRAEYLNDVLFNMRKNSIEPKRLKMVHSYVDKNATLILVEGIKNASVSVICEPPLVLYKNHGEYTEEFCEMQKL